MDKKKLWILIFGVMLLVFAFFSTKISFHDTAEYITIAKYFAGIKNIDLFTAHSLLYPLIISFFLLGWKSLIMIKLVNVLWLFLMGVTLLIWTKNEKAFLLFVFSPLIWHVSIQTTPILPASFFFLLAFLFFNSQLKLGKIYSGVAFGISCAFYTPMILVAFFFLLIFFWKEKFHSLIFYVVAMGIGFLPRMVLDYYLFKMPFYSFLRYAGANAIVSLGLNPGTSNFQILKGVQGVLIFIIMSPLLFKLYKFEFKKYKEITIFLGCVSLIFLIRAALWKYFLILLPIFLILLSRILTEKEIKWNCIFSLVLIGILTGGFFVPSDDSLIKKDLEKIIEKYNPEFILGGPFESLGFAVFSDSDKPYFIWLEDYEASIKNKTIFREYNFEFDSKIPLNNKLKISGVFERFGNKSYDYNSLILVTRKEFKGKEDFSLKECYDLVCVYEKENFVFNNSST